MRFENIVGQSELKRQLVNLVQHNRLSHALLFLGKEGSGALPLALALAQYITCEKANPLFSNNIVGQSLFDLPSTENTEPIPTISDSCGVCSSCIKAGQLIHPDIHFSYPVVPKKSGTSPISTDYICEWREFIKETPYGNIYDWLQFIKADNKQGNITAQECNDINRKLSLKSFESEYKILILWMPEYLGNEGNKLLKQIEEPPSNTLFILVAENENQILPTIVSRCQIIKIPALESDKIEEALKENNHVASLQARQIAVTCEGNFREALRLVKYTEEDPLSTRWQNQLRDWLNAILKTGPVSQTQWVDEISRLGRENQKQFLRYFTHLLEQALRYKVLGSNLPLPENELDFVLRLNKLADISQQQAMLKELDRAHYYIERNANAKILFHALTIKLYHIIQDKIVFLAT